MIDEVFGVRTDHLLKRRNVFNKIANSSTLYVNSVKSYSYMYIFTNIYITT